MEVFCQLLFLCYMFNNYAAALSSTACRSFGGIVVFPVMLYLTHLDQCNRIFLENERAIVLLAWLEEQNLDEACFTEFAVFFFLTFCTVQRPLRPPLPFCRGIFTLFYSACLTTGGRRSPPLRPLRKKKSLQPKATAGSKYEFSHSNIWQKTFIGKHDLET